MGDSSPIRFYNRYTQQIETEAVYGEGFLKWTYGTAIGRLSLEGLVKRAAFSRWYGWRMNRPASREKIAPFIKQYQLDPEEFADEAESFEHFNAFFYRKLKPSCRPIAEGDDVAVFPADGRHFGFQDVSALEAFYVKGQRFDLRALLGDPALAERYSNGAMVFSRLCPVDYHRFHFPTSGRVGETKLLNGALYSVNPIALSQNVKYLWENRRTLTTLMSEVLGEVILLEIGATCVGSINQTCSPNKDMHMGDEKGFFAFGGSSTITLFEPGRIRLAQDLVDWTSKQTEIYAHMGDKLGEAGK